MPRKGLEQFYSADQYKTHFQQLRERYDRLLSANELDVLALHAGQLKRHFLDDSEYPFRANPHFKAMCPLENAANCWVLVRAGQKPTLVIFSAHDFWHQAPDIDTQDWLNMFHVELISTPEAVDKLLPYDKTRTAYIGEHIEVAQALGILNINPEGVLNYLHYQRLFKSPYEVGCVQAANQIAAAGHEAAEAAFFNGANEFDCWLAYMQATKQGPNEAPYEHIIGQNEHAAVLHYRGKSTRTLTDNSRNSMLIDAGAVYRGYVSDISRSYAYREGEYADLIRAVDSLCTRLVSWARPNRTYSALHEQAHFGVASILRDFDLVNMSEQAMVEEQVTQAFMPHGFGHMLGLQVHDCGGNLEDASGRIVPPPAQFPKLKTTRKIELDQVITVEPGIYFIDPLLQGLANGKAAPFINWAAVDHFRMYGGARIEDNVLITEQGGINLTRQQGLS